jgi:hypothetical protein
VTSFYPSGVDESRAYRVSFEAIIFYPTPIVKKLEESIIYWAFWGGGVNEVIQIVEQRLERSNNIVWFLVLFQNPITTLIKSVY